MLSRGQRACPLVPPVATDSAGDEGETARRRTPPKAPLWALPGKPAGDGLPRRRAINHAGAPSFPDISDWRKASDACAEREGQS